MMARIPLLVWALAAALLALSLEATSQTAESAPQQSQGHAGHGSPQEKPKKSERPQDPHPTHKPPDAQAPYPPGTPPKTGLPPITDEDRKAAFPELDGEHTVHDEAIHYFVLFDQFEWQIGDGVSGVSWDNKGRIGGDVNRFWFRTEGEGESADLESAQAHAGVTWNRKLFGTADLAEAAGEDTSGARLALGVRVGFQVRRCL
jgi:uncharacterized protein involved in copper resistance